MARLCPLDPAVQASRKKVTFQALEASRSDSGLRATISVVNGRVVITDVVKLVVARDRRRFAEEVKAKIGLDMATTEEVLLQMVYGIEDRLRLVRPRADARKMRDDAETYSPYVVRNGGICWLKHDQDGDVSVPLCNFDAKIVEEVVTDDGATERGELHIEGTLADGKPLGTARVSMAQFNSMNWPVLEWGSRAIIAAGMGSKDRLREAIQHLSPEVSCRRVYGHTGWRQINGFWRYLHGGGSIGPDGPENLTQVSLGSALSPLHLPDPPEAEGLKAAIRASLEVLDVAPSRITVVLLGFAYRAPLCELLHADMSAHEVGPTGVFKSELAALIQQHYGAGFDRLHFPASWAATPNFLERLVFEAKDAVVVIDDLAPRGTTFDVAKLHATADRVIRGAGNRSSRGRMFADGKLRPDYPPRAILLSTGEDVPRGQSLRSRLMVVEVGPGDVDVPKLTCAQAAGREGQYATAMAGYIQWLACRFEKLREALPPLLKSLRERATHEAQHRRTPEMVASLGAACKMFLEFAADAGAIDKNEEAQTWKRVWTALGDAGAAQATYHEGEEVAGRFLALLASAIASGRAHLADEKQGEPSAHAEQWGWQKVPARHGAGSCPRGACIGWISSDRINVYLDPDAAYACAQQLSHDQGDTLAVTPRTLWKRLHDRRLLASEDAKRGRHVIRRIIGGARRSVLHLEATHLVDLPSGLSGPLGPSGPMGALHPLDSSSPEELDGKTMTTPEGR